MARNLDAKCRQCRREGEKLFLKGEKCFTDKCAIERRSYAPGQHGQKSELCAGRGLCVGHCRGVSFEEGVTPAEIWFGIFSMWDQRVIRPSPERPAESAWTRAGRR